LTVLDDHQTFNSIAERLKEQAENWYASARLRYYRFIEQHGIEKEKDQNECITKFFGTSKANNNQQTAKTPCRNKWPEFDDNMYNKLWSTLGEVGIKSVFHIAHDLLRPYLDRDLKSRMPGWIVSWDGTFSLAKRMMYDLLSEETPGALMMVWGEYGHIMFWAFGDDEKPVHIQRMNYFLRERAREAGKEHEVKWAYSDLCCEGLLDRKNHWFAKMWPSATEAPFKDPFHGIKMVTDSTAGPTHDLNANFSLGVTMIIFGYLESSIKAAIAEIQKEHTHLREWEARREVLKSSTWRAKMYNFTRDGPTAANRMRSLYKETKEQDDKMYKQAKDEGRKYLRYFKDEIPGKRRGTEKEVLNLIRHLELGCYRDPLPAEEMSYAIPQKNIDGNTKIKMKTLRRKRGTSGGESVNKQINKSGKTVSRISSDLGDKRVALRVFHINYEKDKDLEPLLGRKPLTLQYYLFEALEEYARSIPHLACRVSSIFPPSQQLYEPLGLEFMRYSKWQTVDDNMYKQMGLMPPKDTNDQAYDAMESVTEEASVMLAAPSPTTDESPENVDSQAESLTHASFLETQEMSSSTSGIQISPSTGESTKSQSLIDTIHPTEKIPGYSPGNTVWNRKEGRVSLTVPHKQNVYEPLTDFQASEFSKIFNTVVQTKGVHTYAAIAKEMIQVWNKKHFDMLFGSKHSAGLGGVLTPGLVEKRLMIAHDAVEASKRKEEEKLSKLEMQVQINPKKRRKRNVPSNKAPPFDALTESDIQEIEKGTSPVYSADILKEYCKSAGIGPPNTKQKRAKKLVEWWRKYKCSEQPKKDT
jgi:hypothetical protein